MYLKQILTCKAVELCCKAGTTVPVVSLAVEMKIRTVLTALTKKMAAHKPIPNLSSNTLLQNPPLLAPTKFKKLWLYRAITRTIDMYKMLTRTVE
jgi:hypothetical protein